MYYSISVKRLPHVTPELFCDVTRRASVHSFIVLSTNVLM